MAAPKCWKSAPWANLSSMMNRFLSASAHRRSTALICCSARANIRLHLAFPPEIPGMEFAGEIAEVGSSVRRWKPGQRVFGLIGGGAHAEYVVTYEHLLAEIPANLDWTQAAAVPEVFITAHDALWTQANLRPGETVLIHAVGSGVGLAAVQLARAIQAVPYGTSRTADKIEKSKPLGLEAGLRPSRENFDDLATAAEKWTAGKGINVLLDLVGGPYVKASQKAHGPPRPHDSGRHRSRRQL